MSTYGEMTEAERSKALVEALREMKAELNEPAPFIDEIIEREENQNAK